MRDLEGVEHRPGMLAALGLPGIPLAEAAAIGDQHQQRDLVQQRDADDAVDRLQKPVVL